MIAPSLSLSGHILLIDDMAENLRVLKLLLTEQGYEVSAAISGELALKALEQLTPDLILLDIRMAGMNGYQVCQHLKQNPSLRDIPVIFISALNDTEDKIKAFEEGGVDYITKPFNQMEVLARVSTHLQLYHLQKNLRQNNQELERRVNERTLELHSANKALEKALRVKEEFLGMMSHEFRTPLNGILGMLEVIKFKSTDPKLDFIEERGWTLLRMIENLLSLSQHGSMPHSLVTEHSMTVNMERLCQESLREINVLMEQKKLSAELYCDTPPLLLNIPMEIPRLRQVLGNLLDNAVKFTPEHSCIGINVCYLNDTGSLHIGVWDSGPGIPVAERERIFEPFVQLSTGYSRIHEGAGLGLALARNLVKLHGGKIDVGTHKEGGSCFTVIIPATQPYSYGHQSHTV
jgi:two-component system, sensor histidine kinase and response regulator